MDFLSQNKVKLKMKMGINMKEDYLKINLMVMEK
jgi:hypothetical protein